MSGYPNMGGMDFGGDDDLSMVGSTASQVC